MKAKQINAEIKCPKCGYVNLIMGIPPDGSPVSFNEKFIIDSSGVHRAKDYEKRKFKKIGIGFKGISHLIGKMPLLVVCK